MKSIRDLWMFIPVLITILFTPMILHAAESTEVEITVYGKGSNKPEVINDACKRACTKIIPLYVSNADAILANENLVQDIISDNTLIAINRVGSYFGMPDGKMNCIISTKLNIPDIVNYVGSKGVDCEIKPASFGQSMKIHELKKDNEKEVLDNVYDIVKTLLPSYMRWACNMGTPKILNPDDYNVEDNKFFTNIYGRLITKKDSISGDKHMRDQYRNVSSPRVNKFKNKLNSLSCENFYMVPIEVWATADIERYVETGPHQGQPRGDFFSLIYNTLKSLEMTDEEIKSCEKSNIDLAHIDFGRRYYFRNEYAPQFLDKIYDLVSYNALNFVLVDNNGKAHRPYFYINEEYRHKTDKGKHWHAENLSKKAIPDIYTTIERQGNNAEFYQRIVDNSDDLFQYPIIGNLDGERIWSNINTSHRWHSYLYSGHIFNEKAGENFPLVTECAYLDEDWPEEYVFKDKRTPLLIKVASFYLSIPKDEIDNYTKFKAVRDN